MTKISFKSAARKFQAIAPIHFHRKWQIALAALEMAHAIVRGRNPSSGAIVGQNVHRWWLCLLDDRSATDYEGYECSLLWQLADEANDCCDDPVWRALAEAIVICKAYFEKVGRTHMHSKSFRRLVKAGNREANRWSGVIDEPSHHDDFWYGLSLTEA